MGEIGEPGPHIEARQRAAVACTRRSRPHPATQRVHQLGLAQCDALLGPSTLASYVFSSA